MTRCRQSVATLADNVFKTQCHKYLCTFGRPFRYLRCYSVLFVLMAEGKPRDFNSDLVEWKLLVVDVRFRMILRKQGFCLQSLSVETPRPSRNVCKFLENAASIRKTHDSFKKNRVVLSRLRTVIELVKLLVMNAANGWDFVNYWSTCWDWCIRCYL